MNRSEPFTMIPNPAHPVVQNSLTHYRKHSRSRIASTASSSSLTCSLLTPDKDQSQINSQKLSSSSFQAQRLRSPRICQAKLVTAKSSLKPLFKTPARALLDYFEILTESEQQEISNYNQIYYVGQKTSKNTGKIRDDEGYYKAISGDHLAFRYEIKEPLGSGTFGQVFKCYDYKRKTEVAVKIIRNKNKYRKAGDLENKILHELSKADPNDLNCVVKKLRSFEFRGHLCLVFELLSINLYQFIHLKNCEPLALTFVRRIAVQLFMALKTVHSVGIIHCDLKPDNILLRSANKSHIKVIDFGSACQEGNKVFDYIQSRFYRSPEVLLDAGYSKEIDIWSVGCILFELLTGKTLFPANSETELFSMIVECLGMPPKDFISKGKRKGLYIDASGRLRKKAFPASRPVYLLLNSFNPAVVDLIEKCLKWRPEERIDAEEGLSHVWVKGKISC